MKISSHPTARSILSRTSCAYEFAKATQVVETEKRMTEAPNSFVLNKYNNLFTIDQLFLVCPI
jgi:hypothetical protein